MNDKALKECIDGLLEKNLVNPIDDPHALCDACRVAKATIQVHFRTGSLSFCTHHLRINLRSIYEEIEKEADATLKDLLSAQQYQRLVVEGGVADAI